MNTVQALSEAGVELFPGHRATAAVAFAEGLAVLIDGGGPRYVAIEGALVEVCPTAGSIAAKGKRIAVGCGPLGAEPARVQIIEGNAVASTIPFEVDAPSSLLAPWPVVDPQLHTAAMSSADRVAIVSLDGASSRTTKAVDEELVTLEFSPSASWLAVGRQGGDVELYDQNGEYSRTLAPTQPDRGPAVAFSPNEDRVAVASFWGQFRLYSIGGELLASDATKEGDYGLGDVAFVSDYIVQVEAGKLVIRDRDGKRLEAQPQSRSEASVPFTPAQLGPLGVVSSMGGDAMVTIDASGLMTTASVKR